MMSAELKELKEERQKLEERVAVLERHIDSANEKHQKTIEETIAKLNKKHETTLEDIKKIMHGLYDEFYLYFVAFLYLKNHQN